MRIAYLVLLIVAFAAVHLLIGGARLLFALPGYGLIALAAAVSVYSLRRVSVAPQRFAVVSAVIFFGYIALRAALSPVAYLAWPDLFSAFACAAVYLLFACHLTTPGLRLGWMVALGALALAGVLVGAHQFRVGGDWMPFGFLRPESYRGRASGFYICPNHLAGYLDVIALFALAIAIWSRAAITWRVVSAYVAAVCLAGILLSGSRGGFLSFAAGVLVLIALTLVRLSRVGQVSPVKPIVVGVLILVFSVGIGWLAIRQSTLLERRAAMIVSADNIRLRLWSAAIEQAKISPGFGTGAGTYLYYGRKFRPPGVELDPIHTHNDYLQLLAEFGLAGLAAAFLFVWAHGRAGLIAFGQLGTRGERHPWGLSNAAALNIGALSSVAAYAVHSVVDFNLHIPANALLLASVGGMLANPSVEIDAPPGPVALGLRQLVPRLTLVAAGLWLAVVALPKLPGEWYAEESRVARRDGRWLEAANLARLGLGFEKQNPNLYFSLAESDWEQSQHIRNPAIARSFADAAVAPYREALALFPEDARAWLKLAWTLSMLGRVDEADAAFASALAWDPNNGALQTYYGHHLRTLGKTELAIAAYRRAVELSGNPDAKANLLQLEGRAP